MFENVKRIVGQRIRAARKAAGLTQETLGEQVGRTKETISKVERGKSMPAVKDLLRLTGQLDTTLASLFVGVEMEHENRKRIAQEERAMAVLRRLDDKRLEIAIRQIEALQ